MYFVIIYFLGLEQLNDISTKEYFTATNKHSDFVDQMLNRRLRMEDYLFSSYERDFDDDEFILTMFDTNEEHNDTNEGYFQENIQYDGSHSI